MAASTGNYLITIDPVTPWRTLWTDSPAMKPSRDDADGHPFPCILTLHPVADPIPTLSLSTLEKSGRRRSRQIPELTSPTLARSPLSLQERELVFLSSLSYQERGRGECSYRILRLDGDRSEALRAGQNRRGSDAGRENEGEGGPIGASHRRAQPANFDIKNETIIPEGDPIAAQRGEDRRFIRE